MQFSYHIPGQNGKFHTPVLENKFVNVLWLDLFFISCTCPYDISLGTNRKQEFNSHSSVWLFQYNPTTPSPSVPCADQYSCWLVVDPRPYLCNISAAVACPCYMPLHQSTSGMRFYNNIYISAIRTARFWPWFSIFIKIYAFNVGSFLSSCCDSQTTRVSTTSYHNVEWNKLLNHTNLRRIVLTPGKVFLTRTVTAVRHTSHFTGISTAKLSSGWIFPSRPTYPCHQICTQTLRQK